MKINIIIQARMTSSRLKGKVMLPLCEKSVLEIMIERLKGYKKNIIIATTNDGSQKPIIDLCQKLDLKYFEGDTNNVLSRYYNTAKKYNIDKDNIIIRCTSDCPLIDSNILTQTIDYFRKNDYDYVKTGVDSGFPRGMDCEVFRFKLLEDAYNNARNKWELEHVTPYFYITIKDKIKIGYYKNRNDDSKYRLTLDEEDDYKAIKEIYKKFNYKLDFSYEELIKLLENNYYIYEMNSHVEQKQVK